MVGKRLIRDFPGGHGITERHADNVPWGHKSGQARCATQVLQSPRALCESMRMGAHRHFIKEWRKHRGLTQEQLAERIGISRPQLTKIERGVRKYDQAFLEAAAEELRCDPADLLVRDPLDPDGLWTIYDQLRPTERQQLVEMAKVLKRTGTGA